MTDHERIIDTARRVFEALTPGDLDTTFDQITAAAVEVLPDVEFASVTIRHADGTLETKGATDPCLQALDKAQYELQEGPCYDAATDTVHVIAPNLGADERFPQYGPAAVASGIRSQAAIRLFDSPRSQGALNLYSSHVGAFEDFTSLAALFSHQAAMAIGYAQEISNLQDALQTRKTIGQAMGILMERYQLSDDRAFGFLTRISQQRNVKLRLVAQEIVEATEQENGPASPTGGAAQPA